MIIRSTGTLFNDAFAFYKAHAKLLISITLIAGVLQAIASFFMPVEGQYTPTLIPGVIVFLMFVVSMIVSIITMIAMILAIADPSRYRSAMDAIKAATGLFLPMLLVSVLSGLVYLVGFVLFIIPGIIFMVWYAFAYFTLTLEGKRGWDAMKASKAYVEGKWWAVAGRFAALTIVLIAVVLIVEVILSMLVPTQALHSAASALIGSLYSPFALAYMYFVYQDLKAAPAASAEEALLIPPPAAA